LAVVIGDLMALADGNEIVAAIALPRDLSLQGAILNGAGHHRMSSKTARIGSSP